MKKTFKSFELSVHVMRNTRILLSGRLSRKVNHKYSGDYKVFVFLLRYALVYT